MPDTYTLGLKNFRSIEDATVEISPLTVVYGPNGSGKSSLIYGLLTLRNFLTNPNQNLPNLFAYPSISLGGYQEVVHRHDTDNSVSLLLSVVSSSELSSWFALAMNESEAALSMWFPEESFRKDERIVSWPSYLDMAIAIPYQANQQVDRAFSLVDRTPARLEQMEMEKSPIAGTLSWNGMAVTARLKDPFLSNVIFHEVIGQLMERANLVLEIARQTGFAPLSRGFSKPAHNLVHVSPVLGTEDEVASLLAGSTDRFLVYEISRFVEKIANRRIQTQSQIGTSMFTIDSIPIGKGVPASIVNEGFGINQLVYMLAICLYPRYKIVAIEEPEIHLHPSMVRELAIALAEIAVEKDRRLIVSTHSETFVVALLSQIAAGKIKTDDVSFVLAENPNGSTVLTQQKANRNGQIEGGLRAFMASEAKDLVDFLGLSGE